MYFQRKVYDKLLDWKLNYADGYSVLIEGARRVGKSTVVKLFAEQEYDSYILVDFASAPKTLMECFEDIGNTELFLLRLQAATGVQLVPGKSVIIFDEIQLYPKARQALKYLVKESNYHYIATGSLISIRKNVKDIVIPSEVKTIQMFPMDYEEFFWATGNETYSLINKMLIDGKPVGSLNRKLMRDFRIYMAVGGMPQAVEAYINGKSFMEIDNVKREIIRLYENDFKKIDPSGLVGEIYKSIPSQLAKNGTRFLLSKATKKRKTNKDDERLFDLVDSKTVLIANNTTDPRVSLRQTKDYEHFKLYLADTGLFVTLMFIDRPSAENDIYAKLLSDKLPANLGYLYENAVAQIIASSDRELYYHTWKKGESTHNYEIDFLVSSGTKVNAIEVKSSDTGMHKSLLEFGRKYSSAVGDLCVISQKDLGQKDGLRYVPVYMAECYITGEHHGTHF